MKRPRHAFTVIVQTCIVLVAASGAVALHNVPTAAAAPPATPTVTPAAITSEAPFNNEGISSDANPTSANFDGSGDSYSNNALSAAGFAPGQSITTGGFTFQWATPVAGNNDNWLQAEQTIPLTTTASSIGFLGAAADGPSTGTGFVRYSDGSLQTYTLTFSDWTLGGGGEPIAPSDSVAVVTPYRNTPTGQQTVNTYVFVTSVALTSGKTVISVTLPTTANQGAIHIFAIAAAPTSTTRTLKGISNDSAPTQANLDGAGRSYSNNALAAAGLGSGGEVSVYGFDVRWPVVAQATNDDWGTFGAVVPISGSGTTLEVLGAAVGGATSGRATITYSDGTRQAFTLAFSDWTLGGGSQTMLPADYVVAQMPYRNTPTGQDHTTTYIFATFVGLSPKKAPISLTLPKQGAGGRIVVFAVAPGTASIPRNLAGISSDATHNANFDGGGRSYSNNALAVAGLTSGSSVSVGGLRFQWPTNAATTPDCWLAAGQVIPLVSAGATLGFLGAASGGASSGTATITYTDGTTQPFTLALSDWTLDDGSQPILPGESIAAKMPYRNLTTGPQQITTYVFFVSVALAAGKKTRSVTLPSTVSGGNLAVFAVSGVRGVSGGASNTWPTYLGNLGRADHSTNTTLTAGNVGGLKVKWTATGQDGMSDQPIVAHGMIYWGSFDGLLHATNTLGTDVWTANLGQHTAVGCDPTTVGIASTATIGAIGSTKAVFVAGGDDTVYALNAATGSVLWATTLSPSTNHFIWDSPAIFNGSLYIGLSSFGDCPGNSVGKLFKLSAATGAIQNTLALSSVVCPGDGVWGSPTVDVADGIVYFATGNGCTTDPNSSAVEAVSSGDLSLIDRWQIPVQQIGGDTDIGNTPTLFSAAVNGVTHQMIGVAAKNGYYYALDRTDLSAGPLWEDSLATGGECPQCGDGSISPSSWDGTTLYAAAGNTTINGVACTSTVSAINPATGAYLWRQCLTTGPILGAVLTSPGLVFADSQTAVNVFDASSGASLFQYRDTSASSYFDAPPALASGMLYASNSDGHLYALGL